jgi:hypothetical protein
LDLRISTAIKNRQLDTRDTSNADAGALAGASGEACVGVNAAKRSEAASEAMDGQSCSMRLRATQRS